MITAALPNARPLLDSAQNGRSGFRMIKNLELQNFKGFERLDLSGL
jgi:hypothetical protein